MLTRDLFEELYSEDIFKLPATVCIIIDKPWIETKEDERIQLEKILKAIKLELKAVRIISRQSFDLNQGTQYNSAIISFGCKIKPSIPKYQIHKHRNTNVILSDPLNELSKSNKEALWNALQEIFLHKKL